MIDAVMASGGSRAATADGDRRRRTTSTAAGPSTYRSGGRCALGHAPCTSCMSAGSTPARTAAPSWEVAMVAFEIARRHRFCSSCVVPGRRHRSPAAAAIPTRLTMPAGGAALSATPRVSPSGSSSPTKRSPPTWPRSGAAMVPSRGPSHLVGVAMDRPDQCPVVAARLSPAVSSLAGGGRFGSRWFLHRPAALELASLLVLFGWIATGFGAAMNASW